MNEEKQEITLTDEEKQEITLTDEERQPCEIWTRVMGYHRPVCQFNKGKKSEFNQRVCFKEKK